MRCNGSRVRGVEQALEAAEAQWRKVSPGLLPESYLQLDGSIRELLFMAALQIIDHQALLNADGTITVVLSNFDRGIANRIDPAGLHEGIVALRWQLLHGGSGTGEPSVRAQLAKRDALAAALAASIRRVTPAERLDP